MVDWDKRPREGCELPLFAIVVAMTAMAASLAFVRSPAAETRVWVPSVERNSAYGAVATGRASCDKEHLRGRGDMFRTFDSRAAKKPLDGAEIAMLRVVLRDFRETHGFTVDDQQTLQAARRLIGLFQGGETDCARLRALLDVQSLN